MDVDGTVVGNNGLERELAVYTGRVVGGDDLDDNYDRCILPPTNGRQLGRPPSKRKESQMQAIKSQRFSKCSEVGHTRRTCRNPRADFNANYKGNVVEVEDLLDVIKAHEVAIKSSPQFIDKYVPVTWKWFRHHSKLWCTLCVHAGLSVVTPSPCLCVNDEVQFYMFVLSDNLACLPSNRQMFTMVNHGLQPHSFACSVLSSKLACLPGRRQMFTMVNHGLQPYIGAYAWGGNLTCLPCRRQMFTVVNHSLQPVNP
ncbi:LOW QUALITY PROTEIN: hypothetical protein Cgig2_028864 [Carnegiea gigantea]|uniref:Uncharacterized protein n=1 Tax=Carnegiea gigantea TaxID=171969 RepID=A0A9Q1QMC8_9CARY|nr:LOW QUALITY PROTEIN: hypothetical protein Cgig2_028864 [Carnegiea gigantea]